jgi:NADPH2:quinone reductase
LRQHGGPEVLQWEQQPPLPPPARGEVQLRHTAIGLNFIDVYDRTGLYPGKLPAIPGREAAGIVTAVARGVRGVRVGQRVAYFAAPGAYCEVRNIAASLLVALPASITDEQAAAMMLKGLTAEYLLRRTYRVARGDFILVHSAAGGAGSLLVQWARALGAKGAAIIWWMACALSRGGGWRMSFTIRWARIRS